MKFVLFQKAVWMKLQFDLLICWLVFVWFPVWREKSKQSKQPTTNQANTATATEWCRKTKIAFSNWFVLFAVCFNLNSFAARSTIRGCLNLNQTATNQFLNIITELHENNRQINFNCRIVFIIITVC